MQPAGGVDDQHIDVAAVRRLSRVEDDRAGVGVRCVRDDRYPSRSPQILSWSIAAARKVSPAASSTLAPLILVIVRQLGDRRRLAGAVHADDQDDVGHAALEDAHLAVDQRALQQLDHLLAQRLAGVGWAGDAVAFNVAAQLGQDLRRRIDADVGADQDRLEVLVEDLIQFRPLEQRRELGEEALTRLLQALVGLLNVLLLPPPKPVQNHAPRSPLPPAAPPPLARSIRV